MRQSGGIDRGIDILRNTAKSEELEYGFVLGCLKDYSNPRVKLSHLLKLGALIRVKQGIYIFGNKFAKSPYCPEVLANMIYGPSYVSLEWACQHWRLIPERVSTITSVTTKRSCSFQTVLGTFTYEHLHKLAYPIGITYISFSNHQRALIAAPEKALMDLLVLRRGYFTSIKEMEVTLFEDLRIDEESISNFDLSLIEALYHAHPHSAIHFFLKILQKWKRTS